MAKKIKAKRLKQANSRRASSRERGPAKPSGTKTGRSKSRKSAPVKAAKTATTRRPKGTSATLRSSTRNQPRAAEKGERAANESLAGAPASGAPTAVSPSTVPPRTMPELAKQESLTPRQPQRKLIIGGKITVLPNEARKAAEVQAPAAAPQISQRPAEASITSAPKVAWNSLPLPYSAQLRFLLSSAEQECRAAAESPFPFAKFLALLPERVCAKEFALLVMNLSMDIDGISHAISIPREEALSALEKARFSVDELFAGICGPMYRHYAAKLGGSRLDSQELVEKYIVAKVDKRFQYLVSEILLSLIADSARMAEAI
ncbi:MAG: hypothetical protein J5J00_14030 [Deltaproteobacteria bacterium]|nr:hypothetical protein [Deltaproteobacteria bacterium]